MLAVLIRLPHFRRIQGLSHKGCMSTVSCQQVEYIHCGHSLDGSIRILQRSRVLRSLLTRSCTVLLQLGGGCIIGTRKQ